MQSVLFVVGICREESAKMDNKKIYHIEFRMKLGDHSKWCRCKYPVSELDTAERLVEMYNIMDFQFVYRHVEEVLFQ